MIAVLTPICIFTIYLLLIAFYYPHYSFFSFIPFLIPPNPTNPLIWSPEPKKNSRVLWICGLQLFVKFLIHSSRLALHIVLSVLRRTDKRT